MSIDISIYGNNNKTNLILNSPNCVLITYDLSDNINIDGVDLDGYLTSASGEVFNFKLLFNEFNKFDLSGINSLLDFSTDPSYGRFDISLPNLYDVILLQLTGGYDIFRIDKDGNKRENKNTFFTTKF